MSQYEKQSNHEMAEETGIQSANAINISYANGEIENEIILDPKNDRYLVMSVGWEDVGRIHGCLIHIDIIDGKVWIQRDGTEDGIALELEHLGIPKEHIVLGFHVTIDN